MIGADFQQGMELVSLFKVNTVTENYRLIYAAATVISRGYHFQALSKSKTSTLIPCPVDRDDIVSLEIYRHCFTNNYLKHLFSLIIMKAFL